MKRLLLTLAFLGQAGSTAAAQEPPPTPVHPVVDTLWGTPVADPYRWLEDLDSPEVQAWFRAQGAYARSVLDSLPVRSALLKRLRAIHNAGPAEVSLPREAGGRWFYTLRHTGESVARGYVRDPRTAEERRVLDPATVGGTGGAGANRIATFLPSPGGGRVL